MITAVEYYIKERQRETCIVASVEDYRQQLDGYELVLVVPDDDLYKVVDIDTQEDLAYVIFKQGGGR